MHSSTDLIFRKSSYSGHGDNCVEVAATGADAALRDTQNRNLGHVQFPVTEWHAFLAEVKSGHL